MNESVKQAVENNIKEAIALSEYLAQNPETALEEYKSSARMVEILKAHGFSVEQPFAGYETAFRAVLENGDGPSVALIVEYDALPEIGHACGHNLHGALSILAGLSLADLKDKFVGKLVVIGTPAEELFGAKIDMVENGAFEGLALAMMMHSYSGGTTLPNMPAMALRAYKFNFKGRTSHAAAAPWAGRNALNAARGFLDLIDLRRFGLRPGVRINSIITEGGKTSNIIPDSAEVSMEIRSTKLAELQELDDMIQNCAKAAALAMECEMTSLCDRPDYADMICLDTAQDAVTEILRDMGEKVGRLQPPIASSDLGNVSYRCPAIQPMISISKTKYDWHTIEFERATKTPEAYEALQKGARALAELALRTFNDREFRESMRAELDERLAEDC